jgi:hypothetical protein
MSWIWLLSLEKKKITYFLKWVIGLSQPCVLGVYQRLLSFIWFGSFSILLLCCWSSYFQYGNPLYYHNFNISQLSRFRCDGLINKIRYQQRRKEPAKQSRISDPSLEVTMASLFSYQITIVVCMIEDIPTSLRLSVSLSLAINKHSKPSQFICTQLQNMNYVS